MCRKRREICHPFTRRRGGKTPVMVSESVAPRTTRLLPRGNWQDESGEVVEPAVPHFLPQPGAKGRRLTRLDLAEWLTAKDNPLTARVFVNRLWKQFFGTGLSAQVDDLGAQGEWPVHPELLDWLAAEFRDGGWDVKHMVRLLVTSHAYRQSSDPRPDVGEADPGNRWLAAQSPRRLDAEFVRDNALAVAGLIDLEVGGPPGFPYQPAGYYGNLQFPDRAYLPDRDERQYRRGVYAHRQRTFPHPMLAAFDAPSREDCIAARTSANSPQQALTLLNDPTFVEAARVLAASLIGSGAGRRGVRTDLVAAGDGEGAGFPARPPGQGARGVQDRTRRRPHALDRRPGPRAQGRRPGGAGRLDAGLPGRPEPPRNHHTVLNRVGRS